MRAMVPALAAEIGGIVVVCLACALALTAFAVVRVDGGSMEPTLVPGDVVLVQRHGTAFTGDVVMYRLDGDARATLHRVVGASGGGLVTQGDANPVADRRVVAHSRVSGRVWRVLPFGRYARALRAALRRSR